MSEHAVFGIRHHGPGSARSLLRALEEYRPDAILIEGPPEADALIAAVADASLVPPVALLLHVVDDPSRGVFYPFAEFSPEWQAMRHALDRDIAVRFCDLPQTHWLAPAAPAENPSLDDSAEAPAPTEERSDSDSADAWATLAQAGGFADAEALWERLVEQRSEARDLFAAVTELMTALRGDRPPGPVDARREAWMRRELRAEWKAGRERVAIVCGAWHAPALIELPTAKADNALLSNLPKCKIAATWIPWTHGRLRQASGYGAGVTAPGWYRHLWRHGGHALERWMGSAAVLLRESGLDVGPAHSIEATRLAHALAALRGRSQAHLDDTLEALRTVCCDGSEATMGLLREKLLVAECLGEVPADLPDAPLLADLKREQKRLRLAPEASERLLELDLRKDNDLARSRLLYRLRILQVPWGQVESATSRGSFREAWRLRWEPEFPLRLIDAGRYGNTLEPATQACLLQAAAECSALDKLAEWLDLALKAALPGSVAGLLVRLDAVAAASTDLAAMMLALARLAPLTRYGDVRGTDVSALQGLFDHYAARVAVGLPGAMRALDDTAAAAFNEALGGCDDALRLLDRAELSEEWCASLARAIDVADAHPLLSGRATRLLLDRDRLDADAAQTRLRLALSPSQAVAQAAWLEGFLTGGGMILLHRPALLGLIDAWLEELSAERFQELLPLLRRAFSQFEAAERRQLGERIASGAPLGDNAKSSMGGQLDWPRVQRVLPVLARWWNGEVIA